MVAVPFSSSSVFCCAEKPALAGCYQAEHFAPGFNSFHQRKMFGIAIHLLLIRSEEYLVGNTLECTENLKTIIDEVRNAKHFADICFFAALQAVPHVIGINSCQLVHILFTKPQARFELHFPVTL